MTDAADWEVNDLVAERLIFVIRVIAGLVLAAGIIVAIKVGVPYWVDRSGKVIVISSLIATYVQFRLEEHRERGFANWLANAKHVIASRGMSGAAAEQAAAKIESDATERYERARRRVFMNAIGIAMMGELVAAFGGVALSAFATLLGYPFHIQH